MEQEIKNIIAQHNNKIDKFINEEIPEQLKIKNKRMSPEQWFQAQRIIGEQHFYEDGKKIQDNLRAKGYDIKMDMQSNKLSYHGKL
jgi:hypothetical protein